MLGTAVVGPLLHGCVMELLERLTHPIAPQGYFRASLPLPDNSAAHVALRLFTAQRRQALPELAKRFLPRYRGVLTAQSLKTPVCPARGNGSTGSRDSSG